RKVRALAESIDLVVVAVLIAEVPCPSGKNSVVVLMSEFHDPDRSTFVRFDDWLGVDEPREVVGNGSSAGAHLLANS
ncbi:MAG: hypothetical protein AB1634_10540, partial [Thermodesulfobacteriota bacterium]